MRQYQHQLGPLPLKLAERGGIDGVRSDGGTRERALWRASLRSWLPAVDAGPLELVRGTGGVRRGGKLTLATG